LWINLVTAGTLGLALAFEPAEPNVMQRRPRPANQGLLAPFLIWRVALVSFVFLAAVLGVFFYSLGRGDELAMARTLVVNLIVVLEVFYLFNVRYLHYTSYSWKGLLGTPAVLSAVAVVIVAQAMFTYWPAMQALFDTRPLAFLDGVLVICIGMVMMAILEVEKIVMRRTGWLCQ